MKEANIIINGEILTQELSAIVRGAVESVFIILSTNDTKAHTTESRKEMVGKLSYINKLIKRE